LHYQEDNATNFNNNDIFCINTEKPNGNCIKGFGFGNIIDDENIKYVMGKGG